MTGRQAIILVLSLVLAGIFMAGCVYPASDIGATKPVGDTGVSCTLNGAGSASVNGGSYYLINVTLRNNASREMKFTAEDFTLSDLPTNNNNVDITLGANSAGDYEFYFQKDILNIGHAYVFSVHSPDNIRQSADFNMKL